MKVSWSKTALSQLKTISLSDAASVHHNLATRILNRTVVLEKFPEMGTILDFEPDDPVFSKHKYRYLIEGKYKILYCISDDEIRILLLFHTKQAPTKLLQLLRKDH